MSHANLPYHSVRSSDSAFLALGFFGNMISSSLSKLLYPFLLLLTLVGFDYLVGRAGADIFAILTGVVGRCYSLHCDLLVIILLGIGVVSRGSTFTGGITSAPPPKTLLIILSKSSLTIFRLCLVTVTVFKGNSTESVM